MKVFCGLICFVLLVSCSSSQNTHVDPIEPPTTKTYQYTIPEYVEGDFEVAHINDVGIDLDLISSLIENRSLKLHSILIFRHNKLVLEEYFSGQHMLMTSPITWETEYIQFDRTVPHYLASVTKSFISACIGICIDKGLITNTQVKLYEFYPEYSHLFEQDERKMRITLEDVMSMKAGFQWGGEDTDIGMIYGDGPWVEYVLSKPMDSEPGTKFNYSDGLSVILADIVTRVSGKRCDAFAQEYLFDKINIKPPFWDISHWGEVGGGWGLWLLSRDLIKFGNLYLNEGWHDGEYIISPEWVSTSGTRTSQVSQNLYYCLQWWARDYHRNTENHPALIAWGAGNQHIFIIPTLDLVVAFTQGDYNGQGPAPMDLMQSYIIPACFN